MAVLRGALGDRLDLLANTIAPLCVGWTVVGGVLIGAESDRASWRPLGIWFDTVVAAAGYGVLFGIYTLWLNRRVAISAKQRDTQVVCQQIASVLINRCEGVDANQLGVSVWLCHGDSGFDFYARFLLPVTRQPCGVTWGRAKGVAGWLWHLEVDQSLAAVFVERNGLPESRFINLTEGERLGLSWKEWQRARAFTGAIAVRVASQSVARPLGFLVVDYTGTLPASRSNPIDRMLAELERDGARIQQLREALLRRVGEAP